MRVASHGKDCDTSSRTQFGHVTSLILVSERLITIDTERDRYCRRVSCGRRTYPVGCESHVLPYRHIGDKEDCDRKIKLSRAFKHE
ncbi:hypothetical protein A0H81_05137 [Grifola frondosa]|uniref:Uncharacterized protein n=1 Tax=Grifola frondosa TaxID=5627 RepID=A0A1C7MCE4_GRIFR|nr:hypothetical protein A0H81_05137 [Grifola frondosa]